MRARRTGSAIRLFVLALIASVSLTFVDTLPATLTLDSGEPVAGEGVGGELTLIERDDGTMQVALDGQPLYYFAGDAAPGDTNGEGVGGVWFVVQAGGSASAPAATVTVRPLSTGY